jgi:hypothetical protein
LSLTVREACQLGRTPAHKVLEAEKAADELPPRVSRR